MTPISYDAKGAGEATGLSASFIREAVRNGELRARYANTKLIVERDVLVEWVKSLPEEKPA